MRALCRYLGGITLMAAQALSEGVLAPYRAGLMVVQIHRMGVSSQGSTLTGGSTGLGHATTGTVVAVGSAVLITDFLLTQFFFIV